MLCGAEPGPEWQLPRLGQSLFWGAAATRQEVLWAVSLQGSTLPYFAIVTLLELGHPWTGREKKRDEADWTKEGFVSLQLVKGMYVGPG